MNNWLENLKVGDKVFMSTTWHGMSLEKVERLTKTQVQVAGLKFRKDGGNMVGSSGYNRKRLLEHNEENLEEYNQQLTTAHCKRLISDLYNIYRNNRFHFTEEMKASLESALKIAKGE